MPAQFHKYHGLGNDYIVLDPRDFDPELTHERIRRLCDRHYGVGSDGILYGPLDPGAVAGSHESSSPPTEPSFGLRIYNPDGSEAEKSGNGLRIFARFLYDTGRVKSAPFLVNTLGGVVTCSVLDPRDRIRIEMGRVSFQSRDIPVDGPDREVVDEPFAIAGEQLTICAATVGNPHCIVLYSRLSPEETCRLGPLIENDPRFPNRTNVQFLQVRDRDNIAIEIWERGAGYTLASGSSASASAAAAYRLGLCNAAVTVHMPGGVLDIGVDDSWGITLAGPVRSIAQGKLLDDMFA